MDISRGCERDGEWAVGVYIGACKWGWGVPPPAESIPPQCSTIAVHVHTYHELLSLSLSLFLLLSSRSPPHSFLHPRIFSRTLSTLSWHYTVTNRRSCNQEREFDPTAAGRNGEFWMLNKIFFLMIVINALTLFLRARGAAWMVVNFCRFRFRAMWDTHSERRPSGWNIARVWRWWIRELTSKDTKSLSSAREGARMIPVPGPSANPIWTRLFVLQNSVRAVVFQSLVETFRIYTSE